MTYDEEKVDEIVLALLYLTSFTQSGITRAWKGQDWDVLNRLHEKGLISDPKNVNHVKWQLSLSQMLVHSGEEKKVDEAQTLLDAAVKDLSPADQKVHAAQIDRIRKELDKNKSDKK